jgi:hypothetical protein
LLKDLTYVRRDVYKWFSNSSFDHVTEFFTPETV